VIDIDTATSRSTSGSQRSTGRW